MSDQENVVGYVSTITAKDAASLDEAVNEAIAGRKCDIVGYAVDPASTYSAMVYFYGEKPVDDELGQNLSKDQRWEIDRRSVLNLVQFYDLETAAREFGCTAAELKKTYKLK